MSTGEDEPSPNLNGRLRPRKPTTTTPSPQSKNIRKTEGKLAQDRPKRTSTPSKASLRKQDDLATKSDPSSAPLFLCPYCDRKFNTRQTASKHARRIHLSKQDNFIKCLYCNHSDAESNAIIKHMVDSHPNQYFACLDCHTRFPSTTELAEHKFHVCEKQKPAYRSKLRHKTSTRTKKNPKKLLADEKSDSSNENADYIENRGFNGIVISCELKPSEVHDAADIEDKITTNLILPHSKSLGNAGREKNAVIVLDDLQWNKRIPPNFSFHNTDADQILSRLGVVHRSPRVGESRKDLIRMMDEPNEKFEKCFDTSFYSKVAKNVQDNLTKYLDGSFNFNPNKDNTIKTRKSKTGVVINTAEGFPILLAHEQFSRTLVDGLIPRAIAPKHKWKWDTAENDKNVLMLLDQTKRDSHVSNCIITLISSLDIWTQLRMKSKFEGIFKTTPTAKKTEKQNVISMELKEILESRDIPTTSSQVVRYTGKPVEAREGSELPAYLGLSPTNTTCELQPAVLSGEWVRPRCYVCCACGEQTRDARALSAHLTTQHPNAQVQHYEIVGETLLSADILKHLYVPPSQISNRTRPPRGFRDCTKCKKSITLEDLHQHMLDCAGDTPTVRRKCRYRPFGVRRRRPRLPDNTIRKKMRKAISSRHRKKTHMRPRPRIRTEVGDAETIRKMIADLPAKRNRISPSNVSRPRRNILKAKKSVKLRAPEDKRSSKTTTVKTLRKLNKSENTKKQNDADNSSSVDEDDQPLKLSATRATRSANTKKAVQCRAALTKTMKKKQKNRKDPNMRGFQSDYYNYDMAHVQINQNLVNPMFNNHILPRNLLTPDIRNNVFRPGELQSNMYSTYPYYFPNQLALEHAQPSHLSGEQTHQQTLEQAHHANHEMALKQAHDNQLMEQMHHQIAMQQLQQNQQLHINTAQIAQANHHQLPQMPHNQLMTDYTHQKVDVHGAGPSNIRQHSNRDDKNMDGGKTPPIGDGNDASQNKDNAQTPNVPLKHSIASLTSHTNLRDTAALPHHPYLLLAKKSKTVVHESMDNRPNFENEEMADKLDKPPIANDHLEYKKPDEPLNYSTHEPGGKEPRVNDMASRSADPKSFLSNKTSGFRGPEEQVSLLNNSIGPSKVSGELLINSTRKSEGTQDKSVLPINSTSLKNSGEQPILNELKGSVGPNEEMIKIENDKKLNKSRKGLNDCIAMLRTKKGLRLDLGGKEGANEIFDSEISVTVASNPVLPASKNIEKNNANNHINMTPAQVFSRLALPVQFQNESSSKTRTQSVPADLKPSPQTDNYYFQRRKASVDSQYESSHSKLLKARREVCRTRSLSHSEYEQSQMEAIQTENTLFIKPPPKQPSDVDSELIMRRNSLDGISILDDSFYHHGFVETAKTLMSINTSNFTQTVLKNKKGEDVNQLQHSQRVVKEVQKQQNLSSGRVTRDMEKIDSTADHQLSVSPTSRRTRRKPVKKNTILEQQPPFVYERNNKQSAQKQTADKRTAVSPLPNSSYRSYVVSPKEPITQMASASLLSPETSTIKTISINTPPSPQVRNESNKRVINSSDTGANNFLNYEDGSQNKIVKKSPETLNDSIMSMQNLRRHSIELANAQNTSVHNYDILMLQAYREHNEKSHLVTVPSRGHSQSHQTTQNDYSKRTRDDNRCHDRSNEMHSKRFSISTFVSTTQDTHGVMHVNPESIRSDMTRKSPLTREIQDSRQDHFENEQLKRNIHVANVQKQQSNESDLTVENSMTVGGLFENKFTSQENKVKEPYVIDNSSHRLGIRRNSDYYARSSPYQSNIKNMNKVSTSDRSLEMVPDENTDNSLRVYHESAASFRVPTSRFSNAVYTGIPMQPIRCESNEDEVTPLDLSCDPKTRLDKMLDHKSPEFENQCEIPISNEKNCPESPVTSNFRCDYSEQLRNLPQHLHLPYYKPEDNFNRDLVHKTISDEFLGKIDKNNTNVEISMITREDLSNQRSTHQTGRYTDSCLSTKSELSNPLYESSQQSLCNEEIKCKNINTGNMDISSPNKLLSTTPVYDDYLTPRQLHTFNPTINYRQESMHEKTFLENKKIARCSSSQESRIVMETTVPSTDELIQNVESVDQYETNPNMSHRMTCLNTPIDTASDIRSRNNLMLEEVTSGESTVQLCTQNVSEDDHTQIDQDAETARKFAMLPEELVKILGTIPKDHRNQLLNVLPQYVSTPVATSGNGMPNAITSTVVHKNSGKQQVENKQNIVVCDSNRLSVNTAISPSSIIPKKRHSPSQSRGRLNSNEIQTMTVIRPTLMPTLSQNPQMNCDEKTENNGIKFSQNNSSIDKHDTESSLLNSITGLVTEKPLEKDCEETEINVVDFNDLVTLKKNKELPRPPGITYIPPVTTQDLTNKLYSKVKHSNEQTASLRAVRIKPTSSRKASSDEKNLFGNISYKTNIGDEDYTNPRHPQFHNYRTITDFKYENVNPQPKKDYNDDVMLRSSRDSYSNNNLQSERTDSFLANKNTMHEKNENFTSHLCSVVSQNEDTISNKTIQTSNKTITLEPSATAGLHGTNKVIDHFLGQMSSTTLSDGDYSNEQSVKQPNLDFPCDELKEELPNTSSSICAGNNNSKNDLKTNLKSPVPDDKNKMENDESDLYRPSEMINKNPMPETIEHIKICEDRESSPVSCSKREIENNNSILQASSPKEGKSNEEDSDDDVTLAVIKQKQCSQPTTINTDSNTCEIIIKQSNSANLNRKRKHRSKIALKRRKKKILRKSETIQNNKLSGSNLETNITIESTNMSLGFNDKEVKGRQNRKETKTIPVNSVVIIDSDKINNEIIESDVNKENNITENVNKIKEDIEISVLPERNQIECQLDNCIDKNIEIACVDTPNINIDINLQSEEENISATEEIQVVPDVIASCNFKIIETYESVKESHSTTKKKVKSPNINSKRENDFVESTDIVTKNDSTKEISISDIYGLTSTPDEIKHIKLSEASKKDSANESDIKLCSEIREMNTMPLRRSRRGKSMYVDSGYLEDVEQIVQVEDDNKKAPLTMKRLILSRVEKDKKRVSESNISEKRNDIIDSTDCNDSKDGRKSCVKKNKLAKRKKSPCLNRKSKKIKPASANQHLLDSSDHSDINSASESKNLTRRELSQAENKIGDKDTSQKDIKCDTNSANTASLTGNSTSFDNEMVCEVACDSLLDVKDSNVPGKRKLNITKISDTVSSKSKKTKYQKTKSQSDFDSDDDKVLLETKQKITAEKHLTVDNDTSTSDICLKSLEESDGNPLNIGDGAIDNNFKQIVNNSVTAETRVTCYNRQSSHRRPRSSASLKDNANYDPYDIDFEDMVESTTPIVKGKSKSGNNNHSVKFNTDNTVNIKVDECSSSLSKIPKLSSSKSKKIKSSVNNESDSDSSKSDVPLQKYVDEKVSESKQKHKSNKDTISTIDNDEIEKIADLNQTNVCFRHSLDSKGKKSIKRVSKDDNLRESEASVTDHSINTNNNTSDETTTKQQSKEKKTRRTLSAHNGDSNNVSSEVDQQLLSDKFMENFGFYSEKIPRKSNLLASKKISETFHNMVSNDIDDYGYKEKSSKKSNQTENKKKHEISGDVKVLQDPKTMADDATSSIIQSTESGTDIGENLATNETTDVKEIIDDNLDSLVAENIAESVEVKNLDNALCSEQNEGAEASVAQNSDVDYQHSGNFDTIGPDIDLNISVLQTEDDIKLNETPETMKKTNKGSKAIKQLVAGIRNQMYPDIEEIDMFEDKFDKIKRKRRSQAVAAKQIQSIVESNLSVKPRKQTEKKRTAKNTKKNNQSTQVPTKGALKGFESIKISIPTQDLNMPPNVSPPRQQKKRKKVSVKRRKESSESESSCSEIEKEKSTLEKDIYEFKDSEDTELFDLRPSTVMDRFRSMHNKNKFKQKERDKAIGDIDKEKQTAKSDKKTDAKDQEVMIMERGQINELEKYTYIESEKRQKKSALREEGRSVEKDTQRNMSYDAEQLNLKETSEKLLENIDLKSLREKEASLDISAKTQKCAAFEITRDIDEDRSKKDTDEAIASTSGIVPDRMDESDYESELSSPEGEFIFYTSDDINCICPSDNDSDESDVEKGCGRPNCMYKNRNADKNAAIGNIFKNNAVRCEKTDTKEPEKPKPNLDQLFDSLFEIKPSNSEISAHHIEAVSEQTLTKRQSKTGDHEGKIRTRASPISHRDLIKSKQEQKLTSNKDIASVCDECFSSSDCRDHKTLNSESKTNTITNMESDKNNTSKYDFTSNNEIMSDSDSLHIFTVDDKLKENFGYSLVSEECTQVNFADIIADEMVTKNGSNKNDVTRTVDLTTTDASEHEKYNSEDDFDINKPESLTKQYMHFVLPADKATCCAQTEHKSDNSDAESGNESAATKYLKGLSPSEAAKLEIYTMVCAQSTQTVKPEENDLSNHDDFSRSKSEDKVDIPFVERTRIRLQKYDIREIAHKSKSSKSIQTEKNKSCKSSQQDPQVESDDDNVLGKLIDHVLSEPDSDGSVCVNEGVLPLEETDSFATPASRLTAQKHTPRKSDEGISTSHDYSADAFDQASYEDTGVARQRARRKCTVGKQNILAEHWSSESEFDSVPPRRNSADSVVANVSRKKKSRKKEGHHSGGRRGRHTSKNEGRGRRTVSGGRSDDSDSWAVGPSRAPPGPKIRARAAHHYWSSDSEEASGPQPQHGWIVGDSHKKLVTMLAHAKGRKRNNGDKHFD